MKKLLGAAAIAAVLAQVSVALAAAETAKGKVKAFDSAKHELTLDGKKNADVTYYLPPDFQDPGLKPGVRVRVTWELQDGKHVASAVQLKAEKKKKEPAAAAQ